MKRNLLIFKQPDIKNFEKELLGRFVSVPFGELAQGKFNSTKRFLIKLRLVLLYSYFMRLLLLTLNPDHNNHYAEILGDGVRPVIPILGRLYYSLQAVVNWVAIVNVHVLIYYERRSMLDFLTDMRYFTAGQQDSKSFARLGLTSSSAEKQRRTIKLMFLFYRYTMRSLIFAVSAVFTICHTIQAVSCYTNYSYLQTVYYLIHIPLYWYWYSLTASAVMLPLTTWFLSLSFLILRFKQLSQSCWGLKREVANFIRMDQEDGWLGIMERKTKLQRIQDAAKNILMNYGDVTRRTQTYNIPMQYILGNWDYALVPSICLMMYIAFNMCHLLHMMVTNFLLVSFGGTLVMVFIILLQASRVYVEAQTPLGHLFTIQTIAPIGVLSRRKKQKVNVTLM